jgi:hypothetical protein
VRPQAIVSVMRAASFVLLAALLCVVPSCGSPAPAAVDTGPIADTGPPSTHATLSWRVRCDAMGGCTPPPVRTIDANDGAGGHAIWCDVTSFDGTNRVLELDAELPGMYGVHVSGATFPLAGGRVTGDACVVDVVEAADGPLRGACSANLPTVDAPCQLQRLTLDSGVLAFELRCEDLPAVGAPGILRELGPAGSAAGYVTVTVTGCRGL